jgi:putative nucleotidyltransferase with HDIG domain
MGNRAVPGPAQCAELFRRYSLDPGIIAHGELTARVAGLLALALLESGIPVDVELVWAAALLHDVGKAVDPIHHHVASRRILEEHGWPTLGPLVERHLTGLILTGDAPVTWEERLVYYADKLCTTQVVSLVERVDDLCRRYPEHAATFRACLPAMRALEDEIFRQLPWGRDQLLHRLAAAPRAPEEA